MGANTAPVQQEFSPAKEMNEAYRRMKERRIRVSVARSTRAGSIGNDCERYIFYERTVPAAQRVPHDVGKQELFDLGNALEPWVVREIEDAGFQIVGRQKDWFDEELEIGAKGDVRVVRSSWPRPVITEIKGIAPYAADTIETYADVRDHHSPWVRRYADQVQVYLHFDGGPLALFALANKLTGHVAFIDVPRDEARIIELRAKAARIRDAVKTRTAPARTVTDLCQRCPFLTVCMPDRPAGEGVVFYDQAEAIALIDRRLELAEAKSEYDAIDRRLKKILPEAEEVLVGDFVVRGKWKERKAYEVAASKYIERSYVRLPGAAQQPKPAANSAEQMPIGVATAAQERSQPAPAPTESDWT
jgi:hypothetical protein